MIFVWQPLGFGNVFDYPSLTPVTPMALRKLGAAVHIVEFHEQLFLAIIARNGITDDQIDNGYFIASGWEQLSAEQRLWYRNVVGIPDI